MRRGWLAFVVLLILAGASPGGAANYRITQVGLNTGNNFFGFSVNRKGEVAGFIASPQHAAVWSNGVTTDLGTLGGKSSVATGINDAGQIVGGLTYSGIHTDYTRAFLWEQEVMQDLGVLITPVPSFATSFATAINRSGQVTGSTTTNYSDHAFLWQNGVMTDLGHLPGADHSSSGEAINDLGQVAGTARRLVEINGSPVWVETPILVTNGVMQDLGRPPGYSNARASGVNNAGQVVGSAYNLVNGVKQERAFLWQNGVIQELGSLSAGDFSVANGINDAGQVVGRAYQVVNGVPSMGRAFLWQKGVMQDLNNLIPPDSGWFLWQAKGINDAGQIVAWGSYQSDYSGCVVLTPGAPLNAVMLLLE